MPVSNTPEIPLILKSFRKDILDTRYRGGAIPHPHIHGPAHALEQKDYPQVSTKFDDTKLKQYF
jgi:hypothetical protein